VTETQQGGNDSAAPRALIPPHLVLNDFLDRDAAAGVLAYALAREAAFQPTTTGGAAGQRTNPRMRTSLALRDLGPFRAVLSAKMLEHMPEFAARLGVAAVNDARLELELVAHNEGAFYKRHIDTQTASDRDTIRVLSGVYYFHAEPKAFTGGALRLYAIGDPENRRFIDIEPINNSLLAFPAWAPHEVMPVGCPSKRFASSRFAVNCWAHRNREA
jgi:predicted 2-oxoglutarate/Fe(II)-dependent dioxygenase YbiX